MHHSHDLLDEEIAQNILSGAYRLHDFAATTWFGLLERFNHLGRQDTLPHELVDVLETLRCERANGMHTESAEASTQPKLEHFTTLSPALHDMLCKVVGFRQICLEGSFNKGKGAVID